MKNPTAPALSAIPETIEDGPTPLPVEPPDPSEIADFGSLPDGVRDHLVRMHNTQREQDVAIARLWDVRQLGEDVARLSEKIAALSRLSSIPELLRLQGNGIQVLLTWRDSSIKDADKLAATVDRLEHRLGMIDVMFARIESSVSSLGSQIGQVSASLKNEIAGVGDELAALERKTEAQLAALAKRFGEASDALAVRVVSLEDDRKRVKWTIAVLLALAALFGWIARYVTGAK